MSNNPFFAPNMSSDEIYVGQDMTECLTDTVEGKADINHTHNQYASVSHEHTGYTTQSDLDLLEDVIDTKADTSHTHDGYATSSHAHSEYATVIALNTLGEEVDGKANTTHSHTGYASATHTHNEYASITHDHSGYASVEHSHNEYATTTALNEVSDVMSGKANVSHSHNDIYYTETEVDTKLANKSDTSHNHDGVYDVSGAASNALASANAYTDTKIDALVGEGASTTLDTIGEISGAIEDNQDAIDLLNSAIGNKANVSDLTAHTNNATIHVTQVDKNNLNAAKTHADSTHAPSDAEKNQNAFSNVVVGNTTISADTPTDTLTLVAGSNVTLTPNATGDSVTIASINTVYTHPTSSGNKHIPSGGSSGQILRWSADGTVVWGADNNTTYSVATEEINGLMSAEDKAKLNTVAENANYYILPSAGSSLGGVKTGGDVTIANGVIAVNDDSHNHIISNIDGLQSALDGKSANTHNHNNNYYTQVQVDEKDDYTLDTAKTYADSLNTAMDSRMDTAETKLATVASNAEVNQNAFSNVIVGSTTIAADSKTDSLTISAGTGISVSGDATNDKITIVNSGVRSIATGSSNGTISVNTNGTSANVAVKGLGSAAYTASSAYDAAGTAQTKADAALASAKSYADTKVANLINGAPTTLDTLKEIADAMAENEDVVAALETAVGTKANQSSLNSHTSNKSNPHAVTLAQLGVTATASELNKMDGVTATTAELNILDGVTATTAELNYVDGVTSNIQTQLDGKSSSGHTHNYAGSSSVGGAATSANKLNTNAGSTTQPVYFVNGVPVKTTYTLGKSVPSDAKFTDTTYSNATTSASGLMSATDKNKLNLGGIPIVTTGGTGSAYTATVDNLTELVSGQKITIIPHTSCTTIYFTLNVNNLGAKSVFRRKLDNSSHMYQGDSAYNWLESGAPVTLTYNGQSGVWLADATDAGSHDHMAKDIRDTIPITKGGTGATTAAGILTNLGVTATAAELNYVDGVTSNIQTQLNSKSASSHTHSYLPLSGGTLSSSTFGGALNIKNTNSNNSSASAAIKFTNGNGTLGYIGMDAYADGGLKIYSADTNHTDIILDSSNYTSYAADAEHTHSPSEAGITDSGWKNATLSSNFVLYNSSSKARYRKIHKTVHIEGCVKPSATLTGSNDYITIFTLPSGYRPSETQYHICQGSGTHRWLMTITSAGNVTFSRYSNGTSNANASTSTWLPFSATFFID